MRVLILYWSLYGHTHRSSHLTVLKLGFFGQQSKMLRIFSSSGPADHRSSQRNWPGNAGPAQAHPKKTSQ
jgi:hypothetical protein